MLSSTSEEKDTIGTFKLISQKQQKKKLVIYCSEESWLIIFLRRVNYLSEES